MKRGQGVNSIGTCVFCEYHGPGPEHECALLPPKQRNLVVAALSNTDVRELLIRNGHLERDIDAVLEKLNAA